MVISRFVLLAVVLLVSSGCLAYPLSLDGYGDEGWSLFARLGNRIIAEPLNIWVSLIFLAAILHTFFAKKFMRISAVIRERNYRKLAADRRDVTQEREQDRAYRCRMGTYNEEHIVRTRKDDQLSKTAIARRRRVTQNNSLYHPSNFRSTDVPFTSELFYLLGEVEAIFGIWVVVLLAVLTAHIGWQDTKHYLTQDVSYIEPMFVMVIMTITSTKPILVFAEKIMRLCASLFGGSVQAFWFTIMTVGPVLGSFITEPAAMTICALLLARYFYTRQPSTIFSYATLGLLFVNVSVGGTLSNFAAPPVLMVAKKWQWDTMFMISNFGWKAIVGIIIATVSYLLFFRNEFNKLKKQPETTDDNQMPIGIIVVHLLFLAWTVVNAHYPPLFIGGFLFFLAFHHATSAHQQELNIKNPLLVGFFLGGLVIHGGLQGWWIAPVLEGLSSIPLFIGAVVLTAFNDNAAITLLATLVPDLAPQLKYAVVAGAVAGGGLTVIANAPNPAGQSLLNKYFADGVSPLYLFLGALIPTVIVSVVFLSF